MCRMHQSAFFFVLCSPNSWAVSTTLQRATFNPPPPPSCTHMHTQGSKVGNVDQPFSQIKHNYNRLCSNGFHMVHRKWDCCPHGVRLADCVCVCVCVRSWRCSLDHHQHGCGLQCILNGTRGGGKRWVKRWRGDEGGKGEERKLLKRWSHKKKWRHVAGLGVSFKIEVSSVI